LTRVGFYIVDSTERDSRLRLALRLTDKAHQRGNRIFIHAASEDEARWLDEQLWAFRPSSFLPHALVTDEPAEQICIGWGQEPRQHDDLLINLQLAVPPFVGRFQRVAELVNQEPERLEALRASWRHYKSRGYAVEEHRLAGL
jgi:DNA polymerase-3 subunit chi